MRESERIRQIERGKTNQRALERLEIRQTVETPDGWRGFVLEKNKDRGTVTVESWENMGTFEAFRLEPVE